MAVLLPRGRAGAIGHWTTLALKPIRQPFRRGGRHLAGRPDAALWVNSPPRARVRGFKPERRVARGLGLVITCHRALVFVPRRRRALFTPAPDVATTRLRAAVADCFIGDIALADISAGASDLHAIRQTTDRTDLSMPLLDAVPPNTTDLVDQQAFNLLARELSAGFDHGVASNPAAIYGLNGAVNSGCRGCSPVLASRNQAPVSTNRRSASLVVRLGGRL